MCRRSDGPDRYHRRLILGRSALRWVGKENDGARCVRTRSITTRPVNTPATEARPSTLRYLPGLDGLRAISVLAVIVFHHYLIGGHEVGWAPGGFLGVEVFFVVSGYLITSLLLGERRETGRVSLRNFYLRRARRLLPALFTLLAVVIAFALLFLPDSIGTLRSDSLAALTYTSNWWQMIAHRSYIAEAGRPELLKHLWSLAIEEQYYLAWPFLLVFGLRKLGRRAHARHDALHRTAFPRCFSRCSAHGSVDDAYYATYTRLSGLLLGSAFAFSFAPYRIRGLPGKGVRAALDIAGAFGLFVLLAVVRSAAPLRIERLHVPRRRTATTSRCSTAASCSSTSRPSWSSRRRCTRRPTSAAPSAGSRCNGSGCARTASTSGTTRSSASPGPGLDIHRIGIWFVSFRYAGWPVFVNPPGPLLHGRRDLLSVRRDADSQGCDRSLSRGRAAGGRVSAGGASCGAVR